jgi:hypothetical protein
MIDCAPSHGKGQYTSPLASRTSCSRHSHPMPQHAAQCQAKSSQAYVFPMYVSRFKPRNHLRIQFGSHGTEGEETTRRRQALAALKLASSSVTVVRCNDDGPCRPWHQIICLGIRRCWRCSYKQAQALTSSIEASDAGEAFTWMLSPVVPIACKARVGSRK